MVAQTGQGIRVIADPVSATWSRHGRQRLNARPAGSASRPLGFPTISATRTAPGEPMTSKPKATHTPGPWWTDAKYDGSEFGCSVIAARTDCGPLPGNPTRGQVAFATAILPDDARECEANARLIAAAPDLLALAKRYASECSECGGTGVKLVWAENVDHNDAWDHSEPCDACADIRAVIEKAEGRE